MRMHTSQLVSAGRRGLQATSLILALSCGGGGGGGTPTSPTTPSPAPLPTAVTVEILDNSFSPQSVTIAPGGTVTWVFRGSTPQHTVTAVDGSFDSGAVFTQDGASFQRTFGTDLAGTTLTYRCLSHYVCCQMQGSVRVGDTAPQPPSGY